jgi:CRP/FNR family cyclic AMP-dependent transcriptional regulator
MVQDDYRASLLHQIDLFQGVDLSELGLIARQMTEETYDRDQVVFQEGDLGDRLYVILVGTMRVYVEREGKTITYALMQDGECFGEMALIEDAPRSATVRAEALSRCLTLSKQEFLALIGRHPNVALEIMKSLCQRLRHANTLMQ